LISYCLSEVSLEKNTIKEESVEKFEKAYNELLSRIYQEIVMAITSSEVEILRMEYIEAQLIEVANMLMKGIREGKKEEIKDLASIYETYLNYEKEIEEKRKTNLERWKLIIDYMKEVEKGIATEMIERMINELKKIEEERKKKESQRYLA